MIRFRSLPCLLCAIVLTLGLTAVRAAEPIHVPIRADGNQIRIPARLDGSETIWFVLDTGMGVPGVLLTVPDMVSKMDWQKLGEANLGGAGGGSGSTADVFGGVTLHIAGKSFKDRRVIAMKPDSSFVEATRGAPFQGVIGFELFDRYVVEIDYAHQRMLLHEPTTFRTPQSAQTLPFTFGRGNHIFVESNLVLDDESIPVNLVVDTGAGHVLSLETSNDSRIEIPQQVLRATLGRGINGELHGSIGRVSGLRLGSFLLEKPIVSFPDAGHMPTGIGKRSGNLGMGALRRFIVYLDYSRKEMLLKSGKEYGAPFLFDAAGVRLQPHFDAFRVDDVIAGSPAQDRIRKGDVLLAVNGRPTSGMATDELRRIFRQTGQELELKLRRGEEEIEVRLKTRTLL